MEDNMFARQARGFRGQLWSGHGEVGVDGDHGYH